MTTGDRPAMSADADLLKASDAQFRVGEWTVEPHSNRLSKADQQLLIEPRYMDLLVYLAARSGQVIPQDELIEQVWQGQVVGEHSIYQGIARLRKALGDNPAQPDYIATVPKRGYRLVAPVQRSTPQLPAESPGAIFTQTGPVEKPPDEPGAPVSGERRAIR